jgi:hypothetical protein
LQIVCIFGIECRGQLTADLDRALFGIDLLGLEEINVYDSDVPAARVHFNDLDASLGHSKTGSRAIQRIMGKE